MAQIKRLVALVSIIATLLGLAPQAQAEGYFRHAAIAGFIDGFDEIGASQACKDLQDPNKTPDHRDWLSHRGLDTFFTRVNHSPELRKQFVEQAPEWVVRRSDNPNSPDRYWLRCTVWAIYQNRGGNFWLEGEDAWMYEGEPSWVFPILGLDELVGNARADGLDQARLEWAARVQSLEAELAGVKADLQSVVTHIGATDAAGAIAKYDQLDAESAARGGRLNYLQAQVGATTWDGISASIDSLKSQLSNLGTYLGDTAQKLGLRRNDWDGINTSIGTLQDQVRDYSQLLQKIATSLGVTGEGANNQIVGAIQDLKDMVRNRNVAIGILLVLLALAALAYFWRRKKSEPAKDATKDEAELARVKADHERVLRDKDNDISAKNSRIADQAEDLRRKDQTIQTLGRTIERLEQSISWLKMALGLAAKPLVLTGTGLRYIGGEPTIFYANDRYKAGTRFEPLVVIPGDANKMPRAQVLDRLRNDSSFRQQMGVELEEAGQEAA